MKSILNRGKDRSFLFLSKEQKYIIIHDTLNQ